MRSIECCNGNEFAEGLCIKSECPVYVEASSQLSQTPLATELGQRNIRIRTTHEDNLAQVRQILIAERSDAQEPGIINSVSNRIPKGMRWNG